MKWKVWMEREIGRITTSKFWKSSVKCSKNCQIRRWQEKEKEMVRNFNISSNVHYKIKAKKKETFFCIVKIKNILMKKWSKTFALNFWNHKGREMKIYWNLCSSLKNWVWSVHKNIHFPPTSFLVFLTQHYFHSTNLLTLQLLFTIPTLCYISKKTKLCEVFQGNLGKNFHS